MEAKYEFLKNMTVFSRLNLYSNYLKDPQNVDISWDVQLNMAINQWFSCNITTNMIYDNDTKILQKRRNQRPPSAIQRSSGRRFSGYFLKFRDSQICP